MPPRLSTLQVIGIRDQGTEGWAQLRALQFAGLRERVARRSLLQLVPVALALHLFAGRLPNVELAVWSAAALAGIIYAARLDRLLARTRQRAITPGMVRDHALGMVVCALIWALPLAFAVPLGTLGNHLVFWTLAALLIAEMAVAAPQTPLATLSVTGITGAAAVAGFSLRGEFGLGTMAAAFTGIAALAAIIAARSHLGARIAETRLADREQLVSLLLREFEEHEADWLWQIDTARRVRGPSARFARALGQEPDTIEGRSFLELLSGSAWSSGCDAPSLRSLSEQLKLAQSFSNLLVQVDVGGEERWWKLSGAPLADANGRFAGFRGVGSDVTEQRASDQKIAYLARHDPLTGLPNRSMLTEALHDAVRGVEQAGARCAILLIDLDRFKIVNDTLGHPIGDKLLVQVADRLRTVTGRAGRCGRLGGDEFALVAPDTAAAEMDALAEALIDRISQPYEIEGHAISIGASVGSAEAPRDGTTIESLMRHADLALYRAKGEGRGVHRRYQPELRAEAEERRGLEQALQHAVARGELRLAFQPIVEAAGEQLTGFEALLRWHNEQHGTVEPDRCLRLAEETRLILPIGDWVLHDACRQAVRWPGGLRVAVNLSARQLLEPGFAATVHRALTESGLAPHLLELELTEEALLRDQAAAMRALEELRRLGCGLTLDDFGTGTSSLGQLRALRLSSVKIKRSFVRDAVSGHAEGLAIVRAVLAMAGSIGMGTTAEGVETADQATLMRQLGCDRLQGFFYGRPMNGAEALALACRRPSFAAPAPSDVQTEAVAAA